MTSGRRRLVSDEAAAERLAEAIVPSGKPEAPAHEERAEGEPGEASTRVDASADPWGVVVETVRSVDVQGTYVRLRDELSLGDGVVEYAVVLASADRAERNSFDAGLLARAAKLEQDEVERKVGVRLEVLRTTARKEVEEEKRAAAKEAGAKTTGKATIEEVSDRMTANWPDEVASIERRRAEIHAARAVADNLEGAWKSRCQTLRAMLDRYGARRDPG